MIVVWVMGAVEVMLIFSAIYYQLLLLPVVAVSIIDTIEKSASRQSPVSPSLECPLVELSRITSRTRIEKIGVRSHGKAQLLASSLLFGCHLHQ